MVTKIDEVVAQATRIERSPEDLQLQSLAREQVLDLPPATRLRWFSIRPVMHAELERVACDVLELLEEDNDVSIIAVIGLSGVGKTTLAAAIRADLCDRFARDVAAGQMPVLYAEAPANGEKSLSWRVLYQRILHAGGEFAVASLRAARVVGGRLVSAPGRATVAELRELIETMVRHRGVRVIIIDEALHLLRFEAYDAVMDTLKSLSDIGGLKLILLGSYDIAELMLQYGQVARRCEIVHFRPYEVPNVANAKTELPPRPKAPRASEPPSDAYEFSRALEKNLKMWPCADAPDMMPFWWHIMQVCLGSVGLLKMLLLRLAARQMQSKSGKVTLEMLAKAGKSPKALQKLEQELTAGREELEGACYGESKLTKDYLDLFKSRLLESTPDSSAAKQSEEHAHA